jgi:hypothetical protein
MTVKETLTLNQKTMELLQAKGNDKSSKILNDHRMIIEYYNMERERYIRENKEQNIAGLDLFAINHSNDLLIEMQKAVFN